MVWRKINIRMKNSQYSVEYRIVQYLVALDYIILIWKLQQFVLLLFPLDWQEDIKGKWQCFPVYEKVQKVKQ